MKTKQILLTIALLFTSLLFKAQEKYEYLIIEYNTRNWILSLSIAGIEYKSEKADFSNQEKSGFNANPFLLKVQEYEDKGWELINFNSLVSGPNTLAETHFAYMRKKKTDKK
jgi:hypothetical protein